MLIQLWHLCLKKHINVINNNSQTINETLNLYSTHGEKKRVVASHLTLPLSLIEPLPRMDIFAPVSSCNLFMELPLGPSSFPTKLNCNKERKGNRLVSHTACFLDGCLSYLTVNNKKKHLVFLIMHKTSYSERMKNSFLV